jgi:hypothetical protein
LARQVLRAELARLGNVSRQAATKLTALGGKLAAACEGQWVDLDHPAVRDWLESKGRPPTGAPSPPPRVGQKQPQRRPSPARKAPAERVAQDQQGAGPGRGSEHDARATDPETANAYLTELASPLGIESLPRMTMQEVVERFGTLPQLRDLVEARKKIGEIREKDLKNDETVGRLIERDLVRTHVLSHIETSHQRLLQDASTNIARTMYKLAQGGHTIEEAEQTVRDIIGSHLSAVKLLAVKALRGA